MPDEIRYLTAEEVVEAHQVVMTEMGLDPCPLRSLSDLESALNRVRTAAFYNGATFFEQAALLAVSIAQAQLFLDGNKRTAYMSLITFYAFNGYRFIGKPLDLAIFLENQAFASMIEGYGDEPRDKAMQTLTIWLASVSVPR